MTAEAPNPLIQARIYCIQQAVENNIDVSKPDVPDWLRVGVAEYKTGTIITPQVLHRIDQRGGEAERTVPFFPNSDDID